jgi:hypothetical protein
LSGLVARLGNSDQAEGRHGSTAAWVRLAGPSGTPLGVVSHSQRRMPGAPRRARRWTAGKIHSATRYHSMHRPKRCTPRSPLVLAVARVRVTVLASGVWRLTLPRWRDSGLGLGSCSPFVVLSGLVSAGCRVRGVIASFEPRDDTTDWSPDNLVPRHNGSPFCTIDSFHAGLALNLRRRRTGLLDLNMYGGRRRYFNCPPVPSCHVRASSVGDDSSWRKRPGNPEPLGLRSV